MDNALYDTSWVLYSITHLPASLHAIILDPKLSAGGARAQTEALGLSEHAAALHASLAREQEDRPHYEEVEEHERLGVLKECTWRLLLSSRAELEHSSVDAHGRNGKRDHHGDTSTGANSQSTGNHHGHALMISLVYDRTTYKFVIYTTEKTPQSSTSSSRRDLRPEPDSNSDPTAILLCKASPSALKAVTTYLADTFSLALTDITPLKLSPALIRSTLEQYLGTVSIALGRAAFASASAAEAEQESAAEEHERGPEREHLQSTFESIVGTLRITISFAPPVAPSLKTLDITVPPRTMGEQYRHVLDGPNQTTNDSRRPQFMDTLATWIRDKTGLNIDPFPSTIVNGDDNDDNDDEGNAAVGNGTSVATANKTKKNPMRPHTETETETESEASVQEPPPHQPPMRVSRVSTAAYAISVEGRLKFASKPVELVNGFLGLLEHGSNAEGVSEARHENFVREANQQLLNAVLAEARRQVREDG
ncbi:hypothetical protein HRR83_000866 [Exophiala dermatitidis]|uniref:Uncharacterized protein n=1 Tax=Exophiala dermatitidis TaxID=5970 RepID=A0AAN6F246_EXODE|nr:hypothetical protein HRR75_000783 [Exophiala dermatitidis]KAJ4528115.1 hypothetical protein HRR74_000870 [Exophiala dermatitidis]KAJ4528748.1 hypothetical protein HRR73_001371 [Exophiala dermatitidis]KAJ4530134.1 hypothetical protein HRR76_009367 [Exophiala dermatitidis]KAJ4553079.1 hypothetical protein HRR78_003338 [Exophiala dermatitidis]